MKMSRRSRRKTTMVVVLILCCVGAFVASIVLSQKAGAPKTTSQKKVINDSKQNLDKKPEFNKTQYSTTDPSSIWVVVNKPNPLNPRQYTPAQFATVQGHRISDHVAADLNNMIDVAKQQGITLRVISGFRSYDYQANLYNSYVVNDGQANADTYSARPGHSEHQTGFAVDLGGAHGCDVQQCFGDTSEGIWVGQHAAEFGFIVRYTEANRAITGYDAEPWHLRYVGRELASEMRDKKIDSLESFFGIKGGDYVD